LIITIQRSSFYIPFRMIFGTRAVSKIPPKCWPDPTDLTNIFFFSLFFFFLFVTRRDFWARGEMIVYSSDACLSSLLFKGATSLSFHKLL
jgi:hypothetical protein